MFSEPQNLVLLWNLELSFITIVFCSGIHSSPAWDLICSENQRWSLFWLLFAPLYLDGGGDEPHLIISLTHFNICSWCQWSDFWFCPSWSWWHWALKRVSVGVISWSFHLQLFFYPGSLAKGSYASLESKWHSFRATVGTSAWLFLKWISGNPGSEFPLTWDLFLSV